MACSRLNSWQLIWRYQGTSLAKRVSMQFGVQFFNILNHVQLGDPSCFPLSPPIQLQPNGPVTQRETLAIIDRTRKFQQHNDNAASPPIPARLTKAVSVHGSPRVLFEAFYRTAHRGNKRSRPIQVPCSLNGIEFLWASLQRTLFPKGIERNDEKRNRSFFVTNMLSTAVVGLSLFRRLQAVPLRLSDGYSIIRKSRSPRG